jgi:hypothetical protein
MPTLLLCGHVPGMGDSMPSERRAGRAAPRAWLEQGKRIAVKNASTHFGTMDYEIVSDVDHGKIMATVKMPSRKLPEAVLLRLRHPSAAAIKSVTVNGKLWNHFDGDGLCVWHSRPRLCSAANLHARGRACHGSEIVSNGPSELKLSVR